MNRKVALVTGAGFNLGRDIALRLATQGHDIGILVRADVDRAQAVADKIVAGGARAKVVAADVADPDAVNAAVRTVTDVLGPIQVLVNAAAIRPRAQLADTTNEAWDRIIGVNLSGPFYLCRAVAPWMVEHGDGAIVNISGLVALQGGGGGATPVAASKAGLIGLTRALADELGPSGVRANVVVPGRMQTQRSSEPPSEKVADEIRHTPLRRIATTAEVASVCSFLVSDEARYITGQLIHVNGGFYKG
jgi:NAD(P)-dependent dehydrogenase (short-subunit alcohol dehydrogenase family)